MADDQTQRYVARCTEMSEGGKFTWWSGLADALASQSAQIAELQAEVERLQEDGLPAWQCENYERQIAELQASKNLYAEAEIKAHAQLVTAEAQIADLKRALDTARTTAVSAANALYNLQQAGHVPAVHERAVTAVIAEVDAASRISASPLSQGGQE